MKITETIERDCCEQRDLKPYLGKVNSKDRLPSGKPKFCIHCGQIWIIERQRGPNGDCNDALVPLVAVLI